MWAVVGGMRAVVGEMRAGFRGGGGGDAITLPCCLELERSNKYFGTGDEKRPGTFKLVIIACKY